MRPWWLRPPVRSWGSTSAACGLPLCRSGATTRTALRRPGDVGLNFINGMGADRKSTRLNSSHVKNSYAVFCLKKKITRIIVYALVYVAHYSAAEYITSGHH